MQGFFALLSRPLLPSRILSRMISDCEKQASRFIPPAPSLPHTLPLAKVTSLWCYSGLPPYHHPTEPDLTVHAALLGQFRLGAVMSGKENQGACDMLQCDDAAQWNWFHSAANIMSYIIGEHELPFSEAAKQARARTLPPTYKLSDSRCWEVVSFTASQFLSSTAVVFLEQPV